jgi:AmmeMemoRadiSam system protein A
MNDIDEVQGRILIATAREAIASRLEGRPPAYPEPGAALGAASDGLFVSLHRNGRLRGCIGNLRSARPLVETAKSMAEAAAFEDPRFVALTAAELADLEVEITVLGTFFPITGPGDFEIGRHGLYIVARGRSGILLPQVAVEYSWGQETFLAQVCRKAGFDTGAWKSPGAQLYAFEGSVFR